MNKLLNLDQVIYQNKQRERNMLGVFEGILDSCHKQIQRYNAEHKVKECYFTVPALIPGKPPYEYQVLVNYLIHHLSDNGLYCYMMDESRLYISWKPEDIDLEKYHQRRNRIKEATNPYVIRKPPTANPVVSNIGPINRQKYQAAKKTKQKREQTYTAVPTRTQFRPKTLDEFLRTF